MLWFCLMDPKPIFLGMPRPKGDKDKDKLGVLSLSLLWVGYFGKHVTIMVLKTEQRAKPYFFKIPSSTRFWTGFFQLLIDFHQFWAFFRIELAFGF